MAVEKTYNEEPIGGSDAVPMGGSGVIGLVVKTKIGRGRPRKYGLIPYLVIIALKRKRGRPIGSGKKREGKQVPPSTMTPKRNMGRPIGSGRKREVKEEHSYIGTCTTQGDPWKTCCNFKRYGYECTRIKETYFLRTYSYDC